MENWGWRWGSTSNQYQKDTIHTRRSCMSTGPTTMGPAGKRQSTKAWRHMVRHQGTILHPLMEAINVPPYHPLGSIHKPRKNPLCTVLKYLPSVCGRLKTRKDQRGYIALLLLQSSFRWWRQGVDSKIKAHSKRSLATIQTCLTWLQLTHHHHKGG